MVMDRANLLISRLCWILLVMLLAAGASQANINDQVAQLDVDTATLDDVIDIFGEPTAYKWGSQTYTKNNLPNVYIAQYPNGFGIVMANGHIEELRFESPAAGYLFQGQIQVGSSLDNVLSVVGQPTETITGQPSGWEDGVLYKDINGTTGYCYYRRSDQNVRFFFANYAVSALYVTGSTTPPPPPTSSVDPFDDVRSLDLTSTNLSGRNGLIETLKFNEETNWPDPAQMPTDRNPDELMIAAMNPGLGIRSLHQQGITGAGVNVAIIDQPMYLDHPEYDGKIAAYYDTGSDGEQSSMHGPAVASLLAGTNCGTAPGANIYYAAVPSWKQDAAYYADALNWIIAQNESLPASEKIRAVSVSAAPSGPGSPFLYNNQMWDDAVTLAEATGIVILDCTNHHGFISRAWYDLDDMENVAKCTPGSPGYSPSTDPEPLHVPASCRTTAQHYDYHGRDSYIYWGRGGLSWSIPYCTGVMAMGWQIRPELTGEQMVDLLFQTAYIRESGAKIINPTAFINLLNEYKQNTAPVADAGADQLVYAGADGLATVQLDGSGSSDADGDELEYFWFEDANEIATGVDPNVVLAAGVHVIELVVDDSTVSSEPNSVVVTVIEAIEARAYVFPRVLNAKSRGRYVIAKIELPDGVSKDDIADNSLVLIIGDVTIGAVRQRGISSRGQDYVFAYFDRSEVIAQAEGKPKLDIVIAGELTTGQCIYGEDTIKIVKSNGPKKPAPSRRPARNNRGGRVR